MRELPAGWEWKRLGDVGEIISGVTYSSNEASDTPKDNYVLILRAMNINSELNFDDLVYVPSERVTEGQFIKSDDVVIAMSSGSKAIVGKTAQAKRDFEGSFGAFCAVFRCISNVDKKYVGLFFRTPDYRALISHLSRGANINNLRKDNFRSMLIPIPPLAIQRQIVAVLEQAEAVKRQRQEADALTGALLQSVFLEFFGDPMKNEKGWDLKTLSQIVSNKPNSIKRGPFGSSIKKEYFVKTGYKIYEQSNVLQNDFERGYYFIDEKKFRELEDFEVFPNDLLITCSGTGTVGKIAIVPKGIRRGVINQALLKITLDPNQVELTFFKQLFYLKFHDPFSRNILGSAIPNITSVSELKKILYPIPPLALQQQFAHIVESVEQIRERQVESGKEIEGLCEALMQGAFGGELVT